MCCSGPTCTGVEHQGRAMAAIGASPTSEHPRHIWTAASWLCCVWCWPHIPYHSLLSLWSVLSCWQGNARLGSSQDPSWTPAWVPLPIPLVARPCWAALVPSRGRVCSGRIPNSPRFNSSPAGAEARLRAAAGMLALVAGGWHGGDMATSWVELGPRCCASPSIPPWGECLGGGPMARVLGNPQPACLSTDGWHQPPGMCECAGVGQHWGRVV